MKTSAVFLLLLGLAVARGDPTPNQINQLENKNGPQANKPSGLDTASTRNQDLQISHMQYQGNQMTNGLHQDLKSQHPQIPVPQFPNANQAPQFHSQNQGVQFTNQDLSQQFRSQENTQFHSQAQAQQFSNQRQVLSGSPAHQDQEVSSLLQSQQRMTPAAVSMMQAQAKEQIHDFASEQYSGSPQEEFYQDRRSMLDVQNQQSESRFTDPSGQQGGQFFSGLQSTEIRSGSFPQRSAFDSRAQPVVLPRVSHAQSTSVVVSGLKNLPSVPALVYSAGAVPVPSAQVIAYSRPWHHGGAYVRQQWQTPYARYVYSHIL